MKSVVVLLGDSFKINVRENARDEPRRFDVNRNKRNSGNFELNWILGK